VLAILILETFRRCCDETTATATTELCSKSGRLHYIRFRPVAGSKVTLVAHFEDAPVGVGEGEGEGGGEGGRKEEEERGRE